MFTPTTFSKRHSSCEEAVFVSCEEDMVFAEDRRFRRLYYGNEVCMHLLPGPEELAEIRAYARRRRLPFSLVTPIVTETGLNEIERLLPALLAGDEVICNDLGVLRMIGRSRFVPVVGRQLVKGTRDPRILDLDLNESGIEPFLRSSTLNDPDCIDLFSSCGASRVELDNRRAGYDIALDDDWRSSLYHPFVLLSTTRRCQHVFGGYLPVVGNCHKMCRSGQIEYCIQRRRANGPVKENVFWQGAGHWVTNTSPPKRTTGWNLDRLVYQPHPPCRFSTDRVGKVGSWDELYKDPAADRPWDSGEPSAVFERFRAIVRKQAGVGRGNRLLDVGSGSGRNLAGPLAEGWRVTALDISPHAIEEVRKRYPAATCVTDDFIRAGNLAEAFAIVQDFSCFHCIPPEKRAEWVDKVSLHLGDGGYWMLACWAVARPTNSFSLIVLGSVAEWGITPSELHRLLGGRFELVEAVILENAEPLPLGHYLLRKTAGSGSDVRSWPPDPSPRLFMKGPSGTWTQSEDYGYWIEARYVGEKRRRTGPAESAAKAASTACGWDRR